MAVSNKVVVFALLGLSFVAVNYVVANKDASFDLACQSIENDSLFKLKDMSSSNTVSPDSVHLKSVKSKSLQISDSSECINDADNNVSWMDGAADGPALSAAMCVCVCVCVWLRETVWSHGFLT